MLDRNGIVLTDSQNTILEYHNEMIHRLRKGFMRSDLKEFEGVVNDLCRQRLQKAKLKISPEFTLKEVPCAIQELKGVNALILWALSENCSPRQG